MSEHIISLTHIGCLCHFSWYGVSDIIPHKLWPRFANDHMITFCRLLMPLEQFCTRNLLIACYWHFGGLLESLLAFCSKILGGGGDLQKVLCHNNKCRFSNGDTMSWRGHKNPTKCSRIFNCLHSKAVGMKKVGYKHLCHYSALVAKSHYCGTLTQFNLHVWNILFSTAIMSKEHTSEANTIILHKVCYYPQQNSSNSPFESLRILQY